MNILSMDEDIELSLCYECCKCEYLSFFVEKNQKGKEHAQYAEKIRALLM